MTVTPELRTKLHEIAKSQGLPEEHEPVLVDVARALFRDRFLRYYLSGISKEALVDLLRALACSIRDDEHRGDAVHPTKEGLATFFGVVASGYTDTSELASEPVPDTPPWPSS